MLVGDGGEGGGGGGGEGGGGGGGVGGGGKWAYCPTSALSFRKTTQALSRFSNIKQK